MADLADFLGLREEDIDSIRARIDADANAGLTPDEDGYLDTVSGGFWFDITQSPALEIERLWDFAATEVPASLFLLYAWGEYLDAWGVALNLLRKYAVAATGEERFTGNAGTVISAGAQVGAPITDPEEEPRAYAVTVGGAVPSPPTGLGATPSGSGGTLATGTYYYGVTAVLPDTETTPSVAVSAAVVGPTGSVVLDWADYSGATGYKVYRGATATSLLERATVSVSAYTDTAAGAPAGSPPSTASVVLAVAAVESGSAGNTASGTATLSLTPISGIADVTNPNPIAGGADIEIDEAYRERLLLRFAGTQGAGTVADYERWALAYAGVGKVTVQPLHFGSGTVRVMILDAENSPVSPTTIDGLQGVLDPYSASTLSSGSQTLPTATLNCDSTAGFRPTGTLRVGAEFVSYTGLTSNSFTGCTGGTGSVPDDTAINQGGEGRGLAPIGADVVVDTATTLPLSIDAAILFDAGYSLDGEGGTIATRDDLTEAVTAYIDGLEVGEDAVLNHIEARFFRVRGVYDVAGCEINGVGANLAVAADEVATLNAVTLT